MRINPALIFMAAGLCVAASGCSFPRQMTPEQMASAVERCHRLGLRSIEIERLVSPDRYGIVDIQCRTVDPA